MMDNELLTPDFILDKQIQKHCREMHQAPMTKDELRMVRYGIHLASQLAKDEKLIAGARQEGRKEVADLMKGRIYLACDCSRCREIHAKLKDWGLK